MTVNMTIDFTDFEQKPHVWFQDQATAFASLTYFLAHDDDGVIWGRINENGDLILSGDAFPHDVAVPLRSLTLQQARLFGKEGELLVWREGIGEWNGRFLNDDGVDEVDIFDEKHLLWGTASDNPKPEKGFTLMQDGVQGLLHAPPITLARNKTAVLTVRHYLEYDDQGQAYIAMSRLVTIREGI